jgi:hypothetical protein
MAGSLGLAALLLLAGACDPTAVSKDDKAKEGEKGEAKADDAKAGEKAADAGEAAAEAGAEKAGGEVTLDACLGECEAAEGMSEDDRATCRLRCKNTHGAEGGADTKHPVVGAYYGCFDECAGKSPTDRATCEKNCAASVTAGSGDPAKSVCPRGCLESLGSCLAPCEAKGEDDKATCRKQCEVIGTKCVEGCGAEAEPK